MEYIIENLSDIRLIFKRLLEDVYLYSNNLGKIIENNNQCDKTNNMLYDILIEKMYIITEIFYDSVINHLSIINNKYGFGDKLIKPNKKEEKTTIIKYNNIKKCDSCYIKNIINVATIDNISIEKIADNNSNGLNLLIGNLCYFINIDYKNYGKSIDNIINDKLKILEDIEICLLTNIDYITKYIKNILK